MKAEVEGFKSRVIPRAEVPCAAPSPTGEIRKDLASNRITRPTFSRALATDVAQAAQWGRRVVELGFQRDLRGFNLSLGSGDWI